MEKLILKDSTWLRGKYAYHNPTADDEDLESSSCLLRSDDGRMCCLGVDAVRAGFDREVLIPLNTPAAVAAIVTWEGRTEEEEAYIDRWTTQVPGGEYPFANSDDTRHLMEWNDRIDLTDAERVSLMQPVFARYGIELIFLPEE